MIYKGNKKPQPYRTVTTKRGQGYGYRKENEDYLENYGCHQSKDVKGLLI